MPRRKPGYGPDGTPKPVKPSPSIPPKKYGPDGNPIPSPRHWVSEQSGVDADGRHWRIPGHWSDQSTPAKIYDNPEVKKTHVCKMEGAFIVLGGYLKIEDKEVPSGHRGHTLYLKYGGIGVGGMNTNGILKIKVDTWEEFYNRVVSFGNFASAPLPETGLPSTTSIVFYDANSKQIGIASPDVAADVGIAGGTVEVRS